MPITISGTTGVTFPDSSVQNTAATGFGFKNRLINGAMVISQRNAGAAVSPAVDGTYYLDRWRTSLSVAGKFSIQQNAGAVTPPSGFINYLGITSLSAYTVGAGEIFMVQQRIEGYNVGDLAWGTASAATVTFSFWVRSSLTGTFGGSLTNGTGRSYPFTYTISSANTWEQKTVTVAGDTSGTWLTTNGIGLICAFGLGVGSTFSGTAGAWAGSVYYSATGATSVVGTNGATFYITGVQLEKGSTATSFDYRPYGTELALCQRYYAKMVANTGTFTAFGSGLFTNTTTGNIFLKYPVTMRSAPTISQSNCSLNDSINNPAITAVSTTYAGTDSALQIFTVASAGTQYRPMLLNANNNTAAYIDFSSEL